MIEVKTQRPIIYQGDLSELDSFIAEDGNEYFYSADGEHFYNAKGEKVGKFFKKVGGGIVKGAKAIGRVIKKASVAVVKASKKVASGVKKVKGKRKPGAKKLIHHKKKSAQSASPTGLAGLGLGKAGSALASLGKGKNAKMAESNKGILQQGLASLGLSPSQAAIFGRSKTDGGEKDIFSLPLKPITPIEAQQLKPEEVVQVNGQNYSAEGIEPGKEIVVTNDENTGEELVTVPYEANEVVAVTGDDGNVEYIKKEDAKEMNKGLKYALIIGGSVIVLSLIGYLIYTSTKKK